MRNHINVRSCVWTDTGLSTPSPTTRVSAEKGAVPTGSDVVRLGHGGAVPTGWGRLLTLLSICIYLK